MARDREGKDKSDRASELERRDLEATEESRRAAERARLETEAARREIEQEMISYLQAMRNLEEVDEADTAVHRLDELLTRAAARSATLPLVEPDEDKTPITLSTKELHDAATARDEHVLVVEDDESIRSILVEELQKEGYRVREAGDGIQALKKALGDRPTPDLLILDIGLPILDGIGVRAAIRQTHGGKFKELPILTISAGANIKRLLAEEPAYAQEYVFAKPFDLEHMKTVIRARIKEWRALPKGAFW